MFLAFCLLKPKMLNVYQGIWNKTEEFFLVDCSYCIKMGNGVVKIQYSIFHISHVFLNVFNKSEISKCVKFILSIQSSSDGQLKKFNERAVITLHDCSYLSLVSNKSIVHYSNSAVINNEPRTSNFGCVVSHNAID